VGARAESSVDVTGVGLVSALALGVDATYGALQRDASGARSLDDLGLPPGFRGHPCAPPDGAALGLDRAALRYLSPAMRLLHAATREAVAQAGLADDAQRRRAFGIAIGAHTAERSSRSELAALAAGSGGAGAYAGALLARSPLSALRTQPGLLAGLLSQLHGVGGPCFTVVDDATAGGRVVEEAYHAIVDGWCDGWIAGATFDLDDPWILCARPSDAPVLGSAAAVLVLESAHAVRARAGRTLATLTSCRSAPAPPAAPPRDFPTRAVAERLGDTLAAALPVTLALAVRHLAEGATPRVTVAPSGLETVFVLRPPPAAASVVRARPRASAPPRAAAAFAGAW
jgi:3-oxoacyl-(acyl-carrier-protein) synthase